MTFPRLRLDYLLLLFAVVGHAANAGATEFARVDRVQGEAWVEQGKLRQTLAPATVVERDALLRTGPDSRLQLVLFDGSTLTMGENASLRATSVLMDAARSVNQLDLKGAFRMVSGAAQAHRKQDRVVKTPVATIGIRGTDFFAGPMDGALDVVVISGVVDVTTASGQVMLEPGQGTVVHDATSMPSTPIVWGPAKVQRAFAMVAFPEH